MGFNICPRCDAKHGRKHRYCLDCHLAYNREWRRRNPGYKTNPGQHSRGEYKAYKKANREKILAQKRVHRAIESGKLRRPIDCEKCGRSCKPQAHHEDYSQPLDVVWLCPSCHGLRHAELRRVA